jgi:hypothetical protein
MSDQANSSTDNPVNLANIDIRQRCHEMAKKYLPKVDEAINELMATDPYKGILAWERVAEFAVAKEGKSQQLPANTNIVINLQPARMEDAQYIDLSKQKELGEDACYDDTD